MKKNFCSGFCHIFDNDVVAVVVVVLLPFCFVVFVSGFGFCVVYDNLMILNFENIYCVSLLDFPYVV